jgi:ABC-2 type transport system permease protein
MGSGLLNIVKKEVKEMVRDPRLLLGMIIVPLIMFPMLGVTMSTSMSSVEESARHIELGVVNYDTGPRSGELLDYLESREVTIYNYSDAELADFISGSPYEVNLFMEISADFTADLEANASGSVVLYTRMETYSLTESIPSEVVAGHVFEYSQWILDLRITQAFPQAIPGEVENPVLLSSTSVIDGEVVETTPGNVTGQMMSQSLMMPMVLMILLVLAAQLAATSVAMEKEEKTLETLLTMPVSRSSILFGKISGVVVVSALAVVAYIFGFSIYMGSMMAMTPEGLDLNLADMGLTPSLTGMVLLLITLFLSLVSALSLAVLAAAFTEDVRSAQALMGVIYVPIFIPAIILMLVDISQLPGALQGVILAIPFSYPVIAAKALYTADYFFVFIGIVYQVIFTVVTIYLAARFFSSEKILTARFKLGKKGSAFPIISLIRGRKKKQ